MTLRSRAKIGERFWLQWLLVNAVARTVAVFTNVSLVRAALEPAPISYMISAAISGVLIGLVQWLVLRRVLRQAGWWVVASAAGFAVSTFINYGLAGAGRDTLMSDWITYWIIQGAVGGTSVGIMQWLVLRQQMDRAAWWILASTIGSIVLDVIFRGGLFIYPTMASILVAATSGALYGGITGVPLAWILRHPLQIREEPESAARPHAVVGWGFWLVWIVGTVVGSAVGFAMFQAVLGAVGLISDQLMIEAMIGIAIGSPIAIGQWLVLKAQIRRASLWMLASVAGWTLGVPVGLHALFLHVSPTSISSIGFLGLGAVIGSFVGAAQWFILEQKVRSAGWWVPASAVAWGAGLQMGLVALDGISNLAVGVIGLSMLGVVVGIIAGIITGLALIWLLRHPKRVIE